ncbi:MAG: nickel pincer cofactor biosynthesis protein LarB [Polyangiaceae bacterium]|nr:nickel pincer cofactor biosynthesis protein LarB [Polyangiaceae bacterium]
MSTRELLEAVATGAASVEEALEQLRHLPFKDIGVATVDAHRAVRQGVPEVIFGQGKTGAQVLAISRALLESGQNVLVTRLDEPRAAELSAAIPATRYNALARVARIEPNPIERRKAAGVVAVVTGGTSDLPVAEEACETLEAVGIEVDRMFDVGVAGIHRLLHRVEQLRRASAVIAIAGMEGALPSVVGGIVSAPVIAVPTSIGYGTALAGFTPLLAMLTSCASGITVVNIDNGFGAALAVHRTIMACERALQGA